MSKYSVSIDTAELDIATGVIYALCDIKPTDLNLVERRLEDLGYTRLEIMVAIDNYQARLAELKDRKENPEKYARNKGGRPKKENPPIIDPVQLVAEAKQISGDIITEEIESASEEKIAKTGNVNKNKKTADAAAVDEREV